MSLYKEIKSKCLNSNLEILNYNLAIFTFGNVSVIDRDKNVIAIKPSGLSSDLFFIADTYPLPVFTINSI